MPRTSPLTALTLAAALALSTTPALAGSKSSDHGHSHSHDDHAHDHSQDDKAEAIYNGYFDDADIAPRPLSDWQGDWQSLYPYLQDGTLDPVMAHKAETGDKTAAEYRAYYDTGYATDVDRITIAGNTVTFTSASATLTGTYASDGYEILTYAKGNRGVRYIFAKTDGDADAPAYIQFSDHRIAPSPADHYHLYWGNDRAALLEEVTNWPTYYPAALSGAAIVAEMLAH